MTAIPPHWQLESTLPEFRWPSIPPAGADLVLAMLYQFDRGERLPAAERERLQDLQLDGLLRHAWSSCAFYRERWEGHYDPHRPFARADLAALPIITRRDLQERYEGLCSRLPPAAHGRVAETVTSGSTGAAVRVKKTEMSGVFWRAFTLRDYAWHGRDLGGNIAVIRHGITARVADNWGQATHGVVKTGKCLMLPSGTEIGEQLEWLRREAPCYLLTYPSIAGELAALSLKRGVRLPRLLEVATLSEPLSPEVRSLVRAAWGVPMVDIYSAQEVGYIALQCPAAEHYHVQSEGVIVEVLDDAGRACAPGETGRVVVTNLDNFAMPLVRYEIGDFAELGGPCDCGRTLPVLTRIAGRTRNAIVTRDGRRWFPMLGLRSQTDTTKIRQYQFVQTDYERLEARLVLDSPLDETESRRLIERITSRLPPGMSVSIVRVERIERGAGGKYDEVLRAFEAPAAA